jgi:UDP-N-acetylmuramoyl-tripeptide--D-alanyl-D-alanine ligase
MIYTSVNRLLEGVSRVRRFREKQDLGAADNVTFAGIAFDSRVVRGGELFIALKGDTDDGHRFVADALNRGAALALVEREVPEIDPRSLLFADNSLKAFQDIASWWRLCCGTPIVAITGSVGKTTIKEMTARILLETSIGVYSQKSFNNHVGVPYTLCHLRPEHRWAVVEMGMNHAGEIRTLTNMTRPNSALIAKIAPAHIENFGTLEGIARAKLEILEGLDSVTGIALLNGSDRVLLEQYEAGLIKLNSTRYFGDLSCINPSFARVSNVESRGLQGISFNLTVAPLGATRCIQMPVIGVHNAMNAAAAVTAAMSIAPDINFDQIQKGLEGYTSAVMRLEVHNLADGSQVIDDSYNANPSSMAALIQIAHDLKQSGQRVGLVLGDMLELGDSASQAHQSLGKTVCDLKPTFVIGCGDYGEFIVKDSKSNGIDVFTASSHEEAARAALERNWDVLLIKASRSVGLDEVVKKILSSKGELNG